METKQSNSNFKSSQQIVDQNKANDVVKMKVPLSMVDFQVIFVVVAVSTVLVMLFFMELFYIHIFTEWGITIISACILATIYLLALYKISIYSDEVRIKKPFFRETTIPVEKIIDISDFNNFLYKYKIPYFLFLGSAILATTYLSLDNTHRIGNIDLQIIIRSIFVPLMCIIIFINAYRMSHYPKAIKININPGEINLYPENEEKYLLLKKKLDSLLR